MKKLNINNLKTIGITGASGALGKALINKFKTKGFKVIGFTHNKCPEKIEDVGPDKWIYWECGKEFLLEKSLNEIDILILNHGIYSSISSQNLEISIEINALSKLKILNLFEKISSSISNSLGTREVWINTSEAEILPALNPNYEISKSLIGQSITFKRYFPTKNGPTKLIIKKIILGPFKSELNPIGIMSPAFVASSIYNLSKLRIYLIIVSPNPLTYILVVIREIYFLIYYLILKVFNKNY
tara:strand:+ start:979 stop:1707 length:729 start_codon:yes stop_codon:yes gene_type:complete